MNNIKRILLSACLLVPGVLSMQVIGETQNLNQLLRSVEKGRVAESRENKAREQRFAKDKSQQARLLAEMKAELAKQESLSQSLEKQFEENDEKIADAEDRLKERMGSLGELFGHITSAAGDARSNFDTSLVSISYPDRNVFLDELIETTGDATTLPSIEQIERLWFELLREMSEQGKVIKFNTIVSRAEGTQEEPVVRVGTFNAVTEKGEYLKFEEGSLSVLPRQPSGTLIKEASTLAALDNGATQFGIDPTGPTGGSLLSALIDSPTVMERWHQGQLVGYIITIIGIFAMILGLIRLFMLFGISAKVNNQLKTKSLGNNPLGRVLKAASENKDTDTESLELKLNEAILKELPSLTKGEALLKIIAAVAPLLGLLGTVTGMILTFQAITIFGAGDPKAMAGGISSALITTVLGLVVAIPTILMHTFVSSKSKHIIHVLEEQAAGIVAKHQEETHA